MTGAKLAPTRAAQLQVKFSSDAQVIALASFLICLNLLCHRLLHSTGYNINRVISISSGGLPGHTV